MSRSVLLVVVVLIIGIALVGCAAGAGKTVTAADAGKSIEVKKGQTVSVTLEGNPTTGYLWQVAKIDESVLKQTGDFDFDADSNLTGAGGKLTFHFETVGAGSTALQLVYKRPWEKDAKPEKTFDVTIVVK